MTILGRRLGAYWPALAVLALVLAVPLGRTLWTALHRSSLTTPQDDELVWFGNFVDLVTTRDWWVAVATSLVMVAGVVLVQVLLGVLFATALDRLASVWPVLRVVVLLPLGLLSVVSVVTWRDAVANGYLDAWFDLGEVGSRGQLVAVSLAETWRGTGLVAVVVAVALTRVPASLAASAIADGATGLQRWRRVTLPAIAPALAAVTAFRVLDTYRVVDGPLLVDAAGNDLRTAPLLTWSTEFTAFELGLGAAMSLLVLVMAAIVAALVVPLLRVRRWA